MLKNKTEGINVSSTRIETVTFAAQESPFSVKFGLFLAFMASFLLPIAIFSPLIIAKIFGVDLATQVGMTKDNFGFYVFLGQAVGLLTIIAILAIKLKKYQLPWSSVGLRRFRVFQGIRYISGYYLIVLAFLVTLAVILTSLGFDAPTPPDGESGGTGLLNFMGSFWLTFVVAVVLAPIIEEIVFRGVVFSAVKKRHGLVAGVIVSSLVFMLVHINPVQMVSVLPLGIYLAIMYQRTRSIYPGIILHATWNFMVLLIAQSSI